MGVGGGDRGTGRRRERVELKFVTFLNNPKNPFVSSYLSPLLDEEGESGGLGGITRWTWWGCPWNDRNLFQWSSNDPDFRSCDPWRDSG